MVGPSGATAPSAVGLLPAELAEALAVFPFDVPSSLEFAAIHLVVSLVGLTAARAIAGAVAGSVEPAPEPVADPGVAEKRPVPRGNVRSRALAPGTLPTAEDAVALGYLRAGREGATEALLVLAVAEGWVLPQGRGRPVDLFDPARDASTLAARLRTRLPGPRARYAELHAAARAVVVDLEPRLDEQLVARGYLPAPMVRVPAIATFWALVLPFVAMGALRALLRPTPLEAAAPLATTLVVLALGTIASRIDRRTAPGRRYLDWVDDATESLRADVRAQRARGKDELAVAGALDGLEASPALVAARG